MLASGAIPEVANCRLAMLAVVAAIAAERFSGQNVLQQWESATIPIVLTFFIITLATAIPVLRGVPRRGNAMFSADAELINGRLAMIGIAGVLLGCLVKVLPELQCRGAASVAWMPKLHWSSMI